jgi:hypothetical protein
VISTLIGSTVAIGVGWMILPWFGSERMLHDQARALQAALGLLRDMHAEVEAAAAADRAVSIGGWLDRVEQDVQVMRGWALNRCLVVVLVVAGWLGRQW